VGVLVGPTSSAIPEKMTQPAALRILINGIVQGVGFRPFIYRIAREHSLNGWVKNTSSGVEINVVGLAKDLDRFVNSIKKTAPPLARIDSLDFESIPAEDHDTFQILGSQIVEGGFQPISPDVSICDDCLAELFSPSDHRYRYPFINCTNCGPRFTIIKDIPYDRPLTTMAGFRLCPACEEEYQDPLNRRFHAQPVACPKCGPYIWLESADGSIEPSSIKGERALLVCQRELSSGKIVAVKGLGGFHLACDGENRSAVQRLRKRKDRPDKPLAVMMPDLETIREHCQVSKEEEELLLSPKRPILLLKKRTSSKLPLEIAPGQNRIGVMLPYTPLHYLLFSEEESFPVSPYKVLVMTSANFSGNPILTDNQQVKIMLGSIADFFLFHNRDIHIHCDDSVVCALSKTSPAKNVVIPIRRSRGYAPEPIGSPLVSGSVLGVGAELKNTFCLTKGKYAFLGQHIGDLKNLETLQSFQESIQHFQSLFRVNPELIVYDFHPDYLSTRYAQERAADEGLPTLKTQHHHAHIAACLADNNYQQDQPVIGLAFDGVGIGDDGAVWGGEILIADYLEYNRIGHLDYFLLPGGDKAVQEPWRIALALLDKCGIPWKEALPPVAFAETLKDLLPGIEQTGVLKKQLESGVNAPLTSSMGRLFDGVASLLGICHQISYEGQAAIELEALADPQTETSYPVEFKDGLVFQSGHLIHAILNDHLSGIDPGIISARFHNTLVDMVLHAALSIRETHQLKTTALSGGVWQNQTLLEKSINKLHSAGFQVLLHHQVPTNDGGISLGQAAIGQKYLQV